MAVLLGKSAHTAQSRFGSDKPLLRSGLVSIDRDGDPTVARRLHRLATVPATDRRDVNQLLLDAAPGSELDWQDFDHVAEDRNHLESVLKGALASGEPGVNILLYGPPGTGKTEFCKVLARRLGLTLYSVGEADEEGDEPTRDERLRELRLAQRLLAGERRSLILFDEMEDLLSDFSWGLSLFGRSFGSGSRGSKVYLHRLLEEAPAPTLWTMNDARQVNPAVLRRFMFALEMRPLTPAVRQRIWARQLGMNGIEAGIDEARGLAVTFEATPGVAAGGHHGRPPGRRRYRRGASRGAQPVSTVGVRQAAAGDAAALRPFPRSCRHRPGRAGGPSRKQPRAPFLPVPAGSAGNRKKCPDPLPG